MKFDVIVKNARIPQGHANETVDTNILIKDEKIAGFIGCIDGIDADTVIDAEGKLVIPGCIDSHTHFMDPGFSHRETVESGTQQAARGGITTVIDMPCCTVPSARNLEQFNWKKEYWSEHVHIDFALWGGVTGEDVRLKQLDVVKAQADAGAVAFKVYMTPSVPTYPRVTDPELVEIAKAVAETGVSMGVHAENFAMCDFYVNKLKEEGRLDGPAWAEARLELAEKVAIELGISISEATGVRYHVVHMSTSIGAKLIRQGKMRGLDVTSETCPHYLTINAQDAMTEYHACAKIAPPLRSKKDNAELWEGLANGSVDFIATDHAPYNLELEKVGRDIWTAFPGIPGVETMVEIIVNGYNDGKITLETMVDILSKNAAIHYGLYPKKGSMQVGSDADLTIIDLDKVWTIDKDDADSYMQNKYTPLQGITLKGRVNKTIVRGNLVYNEGEGILSKPGFGQWIPRQNTGKLDRKLKFIEYKPTTY